MIRPAMQNCLRLFTLLMSSISGVFALARSGLVISAVSAVMIASGCTSAVDDTQRAWMNKVFRPYVPDVVQGNFISSEQYAKLQIGQSREQVRQILGTPLLSSYFHANRWDYVFEFKRAGQVMGKERRVTVFFEGDKLVKFQGDALPTDVELVAEIDGYAKTKRSFWDVMTGSNKPPVTPPLQQPELLVPSPTNNLPTGAPVPNSGSVSAK
jgi:outer membrane protein assembly factor BamE